MKVLVAIKRVVDPCVPIRVRADGSGIDLANARMSMNPFDEISVEAAVRLREKGEATEVVVVSCGPSECQEVLRTAMAMGADRGILVNTSTALRPLAVAKLLKAVCDQEQPVLVLCGKQAVDDDANQTGQMLAALAGWAQATCASEIAVEAGNLRVRCEIDGGREALLLRLPAVVTSELGLAEPRYVTLPNVMKAKKKPLVILSPEALGVTVNSRLETITVREPPNRTAGVRVKSVDELVERLRDDAKVIQGGM